MKKILFPILALLLITGSSCQKETELTDEQKASIAAEVEKLYRDAVSNLSTLDMEIWSEPWSEDNFNSVNSLVNYFSTLNEFTDSVTYWFSLRESQEVHIADINITVLSSDLVLLTSIANWDIFYKSGEHLIYDGVLLSELWKKEIKGWKVIHLHESFEVPEEETQTVE